MEDCVTTTVSWDIKIQQWPFVTLHIYTNNIEQLAFQLQQKLSQAPGFFKQTPLILSFDEEQFPLDLHIVERVLSVLERYQLKLIGCAGPISWVGELADFFNIPYLIDKNKPIQPLQDPIPSKYILEPLRAGQQFFSQSDVIAMAPVHSGAEIISQGAIHLYDKAQGRLVAGVNGLKTAKIFCKKLEAELLSIAGVFITRKNIPLEYIGKECVISLNQEDKIQIELLTKESL